MYRRNQKIQNRITTGRFTLPVAIFITIICWLLSAFLLPEIQTSKSSYTLWETIQNCFSSSWSERLASFILYSIIGYFLIELNNVFAIIRIRASVQTTIYFLLIAACPMLHLLHAGDMASAAFLIAIFFLFKSYQQVRPAGTIFHSFVFIGAGSLLFPQLIFFIPIFLIGAYSFQSLTLRSFFAALVGWSLPYWLLLGHAYFHNDMSLFYQPFIELSTFQPIDFTKIPLWEIITVGYLFVLYIVSSFHCFVTGYEDKIRTRSYLHFLIFLDFCIFIYLLIQPELGINLLPLLLIGNSILIGHLFALTKSRIANVFFIVSLVGLIALFYFNIWTLL